MSIHVKPTAVERRDMLAQLGRERLRAASDPKLLARLDQAYENVRLIRAGRACHIDLDTEIRAAFRRGDRFYAIELCLATGREDDFIAGRYEGVQP